MPSADTRTPARTYSADGASSLLHAFLQQSEPPSDTADTRQLGSQPEKAPAPSDASHSPASSSQPRASTSRSASASGSSPPAPTTGISYVEDYAGSSKKSRVQLAPDQPLTTHGKPRERVFVACMQCRGRKVRCDGAKPECFNCSRRTDLATDPCNYDAAPRRRGKDRTPGSRKLAPYIPKKTRTTRSRLEEEARRNKSVEAGPSRQPAPQPKSRGKAQTARESPGISSDLADTILLRSPAQAALSDPASDLLFLYPPDVMLSAEPLFLSVEDDRSQDEDRSTSIGAEPSVHFTRETWWDALLGLYAAPSDRPDLAPVLTVDMRHRTSERIAADLRFLFQASLHWVSFINIPRFFSNLFNPLTRQTMQPSLILGALGLATLFQSSDAELGAKGREKALRLVDQARGALEASINSGWIDVGLVQAAWILAFFEIQAHPKLAPYRTLGGMAMLDALIRALSLTTLDVDDPRVSVFVPHAVPIVSSNTPSIAPPPPAYAPLTSAGLPNIVAHSHPEGQAGARLGMPSPGKWQCGCEAYSLGYHWPIVRDLAPQWAEMPMWPKDVSAGETLKEECRRLVWSSVMLTATHNTKTTAGTDWEPQHLWIKDPANYALLFPGENVTPPGTLSIASSKDSIWALYMRTLLLWHSCLRMRCDLSLNDTDRAQYAMSAWLEIDRIEALLNRHTCAVERGFLVQVRDILFNTRMCVSHEFQRFIPEATTGSGQLFYHAKAEQWMMHQLQVATYFSRILQNPKADGNDDSRRNFLMFWFMSQIIRALKLWDADHTLTIALDVARAFAPPTESLMLLWPSPYPRREYERLRARLVQTCLEAGVSPPERTIGYGGPGWTSV
ncbi:hypothetical protein C8Q79DRAFT_916852 [Trametes meyenii]|nr:hypothetical protein C8Q79DRAFT_916852 [Trametes meyenii]